MGFKIVILWTDVALWALLVAVLAYGRRVLVHEQLRATWRKVGRDAPAACALLVLVLLPVR